MKFTETGGHKFASSYDEWYQNAAANAKEKKNQALGDAATNLQKANAAAEAQYNQGKVTYGKKAEQLAEMGLTGSGYSDYLEGKNFAQRNAAKIAAQSEYNLAERTAKDTYSSTMETLEKGYLDYSTGQDAIKMQMLDIAKAGTYRDEELPTVAKGLGYNGKMDPSDPTWKIILDANATARHNYSSENANEYNSTIKKEDGSLNHKVEDIESAVTGGIITEAAGNQIKQNNVNTLVEDIATSIFDASKIAFENLVKTTRETIGREVQNGTISKDDAAKINSLFTNTVVKADNVYFNNNGWSLTDSWIFWEDGHKDFRPGDNFSLAYKTDSGEEKKLRIQVSRQWDADSDSFKEAFKEAANSLPTENGSIFGYGGKVYMTLNTGNGAVKYLELEDRDTVWIGNYPETEVREKTGKKNGMNTLYKLVYGNKKNMRDALSSITAKPATKPSTPADGDGSGENNNENNNENTSAGA